MGRCTKERCHLRLATTLPTSLFFYIGTCFILLYQPVRIFKHIHSIIRVRIPIFHSPAFDVIFMTFGEKHMPADWIQRTRTWWREWERERRVTHTQKKEMRCRGVLSTLMHLQFKLLPVGQTLITQFLAFLLAGRIVSRMRSNCFRNIIDVYVREVTVFELDASRKKKKSSVHQWAG